MFLSKDPNQVRAIFTNDASFHPYVQSSAGNSMQAQILWIANPSQIHWAGLAHGLSFEGNWNCCNQLGGKGGLGFSPFLQWGIILAFFKGRCSSGLAVGSGTIQASNSTCHWNSLVTFYPAQAGMLSLLWLYWLPRGEKWPTLLLHEVSQLAKWWNSC